MHRLFCSLFILAALGVGAPYTRASTITNFTVSGTAYNNTMASLGSCAPYPASCSFSGTLGVNVTSGTLTSVDISFPGLSAFDTLSGSTAYSNGSNEWELFAYNGTSGGDALILSFTTASTPGSLVGFDGGSIDSGLGQTFVGNPNIPYIYIGTGGSITAPAVSGPSVPEPNALALMLVGLGAIGFLGMRKRTTFRDQC